MTSRIGSEPARPATTGTAPAFRAVPPPPPRASAPAARARGPVDGFEAPAGRAPAALTAPVANAARPTSSGRGSPVALTLLDLDGKQAKQAVGQSLAYLGKTQQGAAASGAGFTPDQAFTDTLGMTHVRLDRTQDGLPVFGEQVISHLGKDGKVASVTGEVAPMAVAPDSQGAPKLSAQQAIDVAARAFGDSTGLSPQSRPTATLGYFRADDGQYRKAWQVQVRNTTDSATPYAVNHFVDAQSGKVLKAYNTIDAAFTRPTAGRGPAAAPAAGATPAPVTATATDTPKKFSRTSPARSTVHVGADGTVAAAQLTFQATHGSKTGVSVTLTAPDGSVTRVPVKSASSMSPTVDLGAALKGKAMKGDWTLEVDDSLKKDTGSLKGWSLSLTPAAAPTPTPAGANATTLYSGAVTVGETKNADGTWSLKDTTRGQGIVTRDANNKADPAGATDFKDDNGVWNEKTDSVRQKSATDAQYAAEMTYDLYKSAFGRDSIDGKGFALANNVHLDKNYVNAYWNGTEMSYGDGDGKTAGPLTSLDIGGHEISHGLTEKTAGLIYSGESGGLNEAMSDIFGKGVEWYASQKNPAVKFGWGVGESVWTPGTTGDALRYMDDPTRDGTSIDHLSKYQAGLDVHYSSGIANNAFTLMAQGGTNRTSGLKVDPAGALGMEKALQVMYRAETVYFKPSETFAQAGAAAVQAATDLYGAKSKEVETVTAAWKAVGCLK